jgi:hypothetical protein
MTKRSYKVQTPHGLITRTSARAYSHVVTAVMTLEDGRVLPVEYVFAGRADLAENAAANFRKNLTGLVEKDPASDPRNWKLRKVMASNVDVLITPIERAGQRMDSADLGHV